MTKDEALKQEPVACPYCHNSHTLGAVYFDQNCVGCVKRMTTPPQPEQEPVWNSGPTNKDYVDAMRLKRLHQLTTPPQRTWVGLTDEDLKLLSAEWRIVYGAWMDDFARDIEAKLKEKNT